MKKILNISLYFAIVILACVNLSFYIYGYTNRKINSDNEIIENVDINNLLSEIDHKGDSKTESIQKASLEAKMKLVGMGDKILPQLVNFMKIGPTAKNNHFYYSSIVIIRELGSRRALPMLASLLSITDDSIQKARIIELMGDISWFQDAYLKQILLQYCKDEDPVVSNAAAYALLMVSHDDGRKYLHENLKHSDVLVRKSAVMRLGFLGDYESAPILTKMLEDEFNTDDEKDLRVTIIKVLTHLRYLPAAEKITMFVNSNDKIVRQYSMEYITTLRTTQSYQVLNSVMLDKMDSIQDNGGEAEDTEHIEVILLAKTCCLLNETKDIAAEKIIRNYFPDVYDNKTLNSFAITQAGESGNRNFIEPLHKLLDDNIDQDLSRKALVSLRKITNHRFIQSGQKGFNNEYAYKLWDQWIKDNLDKSHMDWIRFVVDYNIDIVTKERVAGTEYNQLNKLMISPIKFLTRKTFAFELCSRNYEFDLCLKDWYTWWGENKNKSRKDWQTDEINYAYERLVASHVKLRYWAYRRLREEIVNSPVQSKMFWLTAPPKMLVLARNYWKERFNKFNNHQDYKLINEIP